MEINEKYSKKIAKVVEEALEEKLLLRSASIHFDFSSPEGVKFVKATARCAKLPAAKPKKEGKVDEVATEELKKVTEPAKEEVKEEVKEEAPKAEEKPKKAKKAKKEKKAKK